MSADNLEKTRLLILDDDTNQRKTLTDALLLEGLHADGFGSGNKGLEKAKQENYTAALIDLKLADMSGLEAIRAIKTTDTGYRMHFTHRVCIPGISH